MDWKNLLRPETLAQLIVNHDHNANLRGTRHEQDFKPVARLFNPTGIGTWLISECDEDGLAFGLADVGEPELGYISMQELAELRLPAGLTIEEDLYWTADKPLTEYLSAAKAGRQI